MQPDDVADRVHRCEAVLREHGLPITVQRRVLIETLLATDQHPTAEELFEVARESLPAISRTTVYRVLDTLVDLGLALRVPHPAGATRFDGDTTPHNHAACRRCGRVFDVFDPDQSGAPTPVGLPAGFAVEGYAVLFTGTCVSCQRRN